MSMDGLSLYAVISELQPLVGGKIDKVQQPDKDSLLLTVRTSGRSIRLLICIHAENGRIQLTDLPSENPAEPPMFCMLLRKHLLGRRIETILQKDLDRYCTIGISGRNELGDSEVLSICIELMDRHSNVSLVRNGRIVDCMRHVSPDMSPIRVLLPGGSFEDPPVQDKISSFDVKMPDIRKMLATQNPVGFFQENCSGVSRNVTSLLFGSDPDPERIYSVLQQLRDRQFCPCMIMKPSGAPSCVIPFLPADPDVPRKEYRSMSAAYDDFYQKKDSAVKISRNGSALKKTLEIRLKRAKNKMAMYEESLRNEPQMEMNRMYGELITANLYAIRRGQSTLHTVDYTTDPPAKIFIPLDPLVSPAENAQKYFKKYKKAKTARDFALKKMEEEREEIRYLEGQLDNLGKCSTLQELGEIREELVLLKYIKSDHRIHKLPKDVSKPMSFLSTDGIRVLVGKNNRQNDELTMRTATHDTLWLHVKDIPGSHVILETPGMPPDTTLYDAAMLAAFYSRARGSTSVPVDYTFRKNIRKPSGSKPGKVVYVSNKTIYVTPSEKKVLELEQNEKKGKEKA